MGVLVKLTIFPTWGSGRNGPPYQEIICLYVCITFLPLSNAKLEMVKPFGSGISDICLGAGRGILPPPLKTYLFKDLESHIHECFYLVMGT